MVAELLWSYRKLYLDTTNYLTPEDYQKVQAESQQAWSALKAAFEHRESFSRELLIDSTEGALERVTQQLVNWAKELEWPEDGDSGIWKSTAENAEECCEKTSLFMASRLWPFTKIIRYQSSWLNGRDIADDVS